LNEKIESDFINITQYVEKTYKKCEMIEDDFQIYGDKNVYDILAKSSWVEKDCVD
jgi:hypothetical protein